MTNRRIDLSTALLGQPVAMELRAWRAWLAALLRHAGTDWVLEIGTPFGRSTIDGVAIVAIRGPLFRGTFFDDYRDLRTAIGRAVADPSADAVLLDVHSPGGDLAGLFDLVDYVRGLRGAKPIHALANDQMTSAAYAIASAADRVHMTRTGVVGSIGVVAAHVDESAADKRAGFKWTEIASGKRKLDLSSHKPIAKEGIELLGGVVDDAAAHLIDLVATNRALNAASVRAQEARVFFGQQAIDVGLVDSMGTFDDAVAAAKRDAVPESERKARAAQADMYAACKEVADRCGYVGVTWADADELAREVGSYERAAQLIRARGSHALMAAFGETLWKQEAERERAKRERWKYQ